MFNYIVIRGSEEGRRDELFKLVKRIGEELIMGNDRNIRDISDIRRIEDHSEFLAKLWELTTEYRMKVNDFSCGDCNMAHLAALGALLLSWSLTTSIAKGCDASRENIIINSCEVPFTLDLRACFLDTIDKEGADFLRVLRENAFKIAPRCNDRNVDDRRCVCKH